MDKYTEELIKKNSALLRQFTDIHNEIKDLKGRVKKLEEMPTIEEIGERLKRKGYEKVGGFPVNEES